MTAYTDTWVDGYYHHVYAGSQYLGKSYIAGHYNHTRTLGLADSAKNVRRGNINDYKQKIAELKKNIAQKAEEEKQARIKAYWEKHADRKKALDSEKRRLEGEKSKLNADIAAVEAQLAQKVPSQIKIDELRSSITNLENKKQELGLFSMKEKKQISNEIKANQAEIDSLQAKAEAERNTKNGPLNKKRDELRSKLKTVTGKIADIDTELTRDPGVNLLK